MTFTDINRACEAILDRAEKRVMQHALTPRDKQKLMASGSISFPAQGNVTPQKNKTNIKRATKAFSIEEIKAKLRVIEELREDGLTILDACRVSGISQGNLHRWQKMIEKNNE